MWILLFSMWKSQFCTHKSHMQWHLGGGRYNIVRNVKYFCTQFHKKQCAFFSQLCHHVCCFIFLGNQHWLLRYSCVSSRFSIYNYFSFSYSFNNATVHYLQHHKVFHNSLIWQTLKQLGFKKGGDPRLLIKCLLCSNLVLDLFKKK